MLRRRSALAAPEEDCKRLLAADHHNPHSILGAHPATIKRKPGAIVRAFHPDAEAAWCVLPDGESRAMDLMESGLFAVFLADASLPLRYKIRFRFPDGGEWEKDDPYRFPPTVGETDTYLLGEGTHRRLWDCLGAHARSLDDCEGVAFAVWAPNARRVSVVGDFCRWDGRVYQMRSMGASGVFEIFVPGVRPGAVYKFEIKSSRGTTGLRADPFAFATELPPKTGSVVAASSHEWGDTDWMKRRDAYRPVSEPMSIYEVHLGSWKRVEEESGRPLTYREHARELVQHVKALGFTHIELLPVAEHPFAGSWGYQVTGYYAPTSRFGSPDDFRFLVDQCHQNGIGVIVDWVPAHFPKDDFALRQFDGTALYEHADTRRGEHPDWGTLIFNYGRNEVKNFLIANALFWLQVFHIDGLRVDAVASMLYLDYGRKDGEWVPNRHGGRENLEAVEFLRALNDAVKIECPGCFTVAEESTAWPGVTKPTGEGGLGFTFKWNMGWMHDTLEFFGKEPVHRKHHHDQLTFAMLYEYSEIFIMPLSHDEVVHMKGSLIGKMPGDDWQRFANLRALLTYQFTRPGKQLLFMGAEIPQEREWNHDMSLDWHLAREKPLCAAFGRFVSDLGRLYRDEPSMWLRDADPGGFQWIDCADRDSSVFSYVRWDEARPIVVVLNLTPVVREAYRIGAPISGRYVKLFCTDDERYGGSQFETPEEYHTEPVGLHGFEQSLVLQLPPLSALILKQPA